MTEIFKHIAQSDNDDPVRFFRDIVDPAQFQKAIKLFMPTEIEINETTKKIFYDPPGEYRNINYVNYSFECKEKDIDYKPEKKGDADAMYFWQPHSFKNILQKVLTDQAKKSEAHIDAYLLSKADSISTTASYLKHDLSILKIPLLNGQQNEFFVREINAVIDRLCNYVSTKLANNEVQPRITKVNLEKIYNYLVDNQGLDVEKSKFIEWFFAFNGKNIPKEVIEIKIKNSKFIYYLLSQIHAIAPIDLHELSNSDLLWFQGRKLTSFKMSHWDKYPSGIPALEKKAISNFFKE